jgi:hypothetical protein
MAPPAPDTDQRADAGPRPQAASLPLASKVVPAWALLPLRLFLGLTFIDAGLGKLLSPAYFGAGPRGFATLAESFAKGSPLAGLCGQWYWPTRSCSPCCWPFWSWWPGSAR